MRVLMAMWPKKFALCRDSGKRFAVSTRRTSRKSSRKTSRLCSPAWAAKLYAVVRRRFAKGEQVVITVDRRKRGIIAASVAGPGKR